MTSHIDDYIIRLSSRTYWRIMTHVNINEIKTHLSHYLNLVEKGETIVVCKRNIPIAEISPITTQLLKRPLGLAKGKGFVPSSFFDPLPQEELDKWNGKKKKKK